MPGPRHRPRRRVRGLCACHVAVALYLRDIVDPGGGWGDDADSGDLRDVRESLLAAADAVVSDGAEAVAVAYRLAALLDDRQPARNVRAQLAERFARVVEALREAGADGLLYPTVGRPLLLSAETGALAAVGPEWPGRVVVAGDIPVPDGPIASFVRSGAQLVELASRSRRPVPDDAVFVANPRGDRKQASMDALFLRRTFYPRSTGLGDTGENASGAGTPDEVRARLGASVLHLGCGVTAEGGLELAGSAVLERADIAQGPPATTGGLAVLPPVAGTAALTDALLAARFAGVVRFRDPIPDDVASIIHFVLHDRLVDGYRDPARTVTAVRRWLADPDRVAPHGLPPWLEARAADADLAEPRYRNALLYHGV